VFKQSQTLGEFERITQSWGEQEKRRKSAVKDNVAINSQRLAEPAVSAAACVWYSQQ